MAGQRPASAVTLPRALHARRAQHELAPGGTLSKVFHAFVWKISARRRVLFQPVLTGACQVPSLCGRYFVIPKPEHSLDCLDFNVLHAHWLSRSINGGCW